MVMIRKQIYLDKATDQRLKREAKRRGISQAALIREQLAARDPVENVAIPNPAAREWLLERLSKVAETAGDGPGTGWKFDRDEIYAERTEKARPSRLQRSDHSRRSTRTG
jgi:hypothetical protein